MSILCVTGFRGDFSVIPHSAVEKTCGTLPILTVLMDGTAETPLKVPERRSEVRVASFAGCTER
jgi:hypothetical protein